jgi:hypothetical protein
MFRISFELKARNAGFTCVRETFFTSKDVDWSRIDISNARVSYQGVKLSMARVSPGSSQIRATIH